MNKLTAASTALALVLIAAPPVAANEPEAARLRASMAVLSTQIIDGIAAQGRELLLPVGLQQATREVQAMYPQQPFQLLLIDDPQPNARALPGGQVLLNLGLLLDLESHAELLFVLAHEIAHMQLGHFNSRITESAAGRSDAMEDEADELAGRKLTQFGWSVDSIPELLQRTRSRQASSAPPAPLRPLENRWGQLAESVLHLQALAVERLLAVDRIDAVEPFLERHGGQFSATDVARWRWMIEQRKSSSPADDRALQPPTLPSAALNLPNRFGQCPRPSPVRPAAEAVGRVSKLGQLRIQHPRNWRVALRTGRQMVLTPDHSGLTRLDVWKAGATPSGKAARLLPCASSRHSLWHAATEFLALEPSQKLSLIDAAEAPDGVSLEMAMTDESGLRWRLTGWRLRRNGETVYALFRAPQQHFFQLHGRTAQTIVSGLAVKREGAAP